MNSTMFSSRKGPPEVLIDVPGVVGQFMTDLTPFDLVVELVQNELDAGSEKTTITFGQEALLCEGNGKPIDREGWNRLRYVLGAGGDVAAKVGGIGAKNHGLRSGFLLGDSIIVQSAGHQIELTVRGNEANPSRFFPAVWPPVADPTAPTNGTRITVPYRSASLMIPNGDQTCLETVGADDIAGLFDEAVKDSPARFIAASAPGRRWRYELTLASSTGSVRLVFHCEPLKGKFAGLFRRTCHRQERGQRARVVLRQIGCAFDLKLASNDRAKVPKLFRKGSRLLGEISWHVDRNDIPKSGCGALRYPIGYPTEHVSSGFGFDVSGPFISGRARHSLSDDPRNQLIRETACAAFVDITKRKLITLFGASSMELVSSEGVPNQDAEKRLVNQLLGANALPIANIVNKPKRGTLVVGLMHAASPPVVTIASPSYHQANVEASLVRLAASTGNLLHPDVHERVVVALLQMKKGGDGRVALFDEFAAACAVLIDQAPPLQQAATVDWIEDVAAVLGALETSRHRASIPTDFVERLKKEGRLPNAVGKAAQWANLRRSDKAIPAIPGIVDPDILNSRLSKLSLLKDGSLKISVFNLNEFVSNKDFGPVGSTGRQRFFTWLRKAHSDLSPRALAKIASYPIWPGVDRKHRPLSKYCWPKQPELRTLVHSANVAPSEEVVTFRGLRRSHNGALRLRTKPDNGELRNWYTRQTEIVEQLLATTQNPAAIRTVFAIEKSLDRLRQLEEYDITVISNGHRSFSRSGEYKSIASLHCPTLAVERCGLLDDQVAAGNFVAVYKLLGSQQKPTKPALIQALVTDKNQSLLFNRLEAYKLLGQDLADLSEEPIILVQGVAMAPCTLTFSASTNWWGEWKTTLDDPPEIPERVHLFEQLGVVRQALREELSRGFFDWLSKQSKARKMAHVPQIIRHWGERRHGPSKWIQRCPLIPCIPVYGHAVDFDLLSYKKVTSLRPTAFLPDFREIQSQLIEDNLNLRLAITSAKGVGDSVLDIMREVGVPSLRQKVGRPIRILTSEGVESEPQLEALLALAQSKAVRGSLTQRLPEFDVPVAALRRDWRRRLEALKGVRVAGRLNAVYSLLKREYEVPADSGVDEPTQLLCVDRKADRKMAFYEALADHLFAENSSRLWAYGLRRAIESRHQSELFDFEGALDDDESGDSAEENLSGNPSPTSDPPNKGHGISDDKLEPVVPQPKALDDISDETKLSGKKNAPWKGARSPASTDERRNSVEEEEQKLALKKEHYAWHCQACLGQYNPKEVAPPQSYVFLPAYRRRLIEAHHVSHLQNKGAIGAKNLVVLCSFHHDYLGDRLSAKAIQNALATAKRVTRKFPNNTDGTTSVPQQGLLAEIKMDDARGDALLFFTDQHAAAWTRPDK